VNFIIFGYLTASIGIMVFIFITIILVICTFAPLSRLEMWWIRGWDFPRLQLFVGGISLFILEVLFLDLSQFPDQITVVLTSICIGYIGWWVIPYTAFFKYEVKSAVDPDPDYSISILVANVLITNKKVDTLLHLIDHHKPDVLVTLESTQWWQDQLKPIEADYPYTIKCPLENSYGMHVFSKLKLLQPEIRFLVEKEVPSMRAGIVLPSGEEVQIHFLHPAPPSPTENDTSIERDAELLIVAKEVKDHKVPVIVTGDMNDVAWSFTTRLFRKISGLMDPRVGRGMYSTFHADYPLFRWPLDHLFHSRHFKVISLERLPHFGSDHFPILVHLELMNGHIPNHNGLESTEEDEVIAEEMIEKPNQDI